MAVEWVVDVLSNLVLENLTVAPRVDGVLIRARPKLKRSIGVNFLGYKWNKA